MDITDDIKFILEEDGFTINRFEYTLNHTLEVDLEKAGEELLMTWDLNDSEITSAIPNLLIATLEDKFNSASGGPSQSEGSNPQ